MKFPKILAALATTGALCAPYALAQGSYAETFALNCDVPVCNIETAIEELRSKSENERYTFINQLKADYKDSNDVKVLKNLLDTAKAIEGLTIELGDADWVTREAVLLANDSVVSLAKYTKPVGSDIAFLFKQIDSEGKRYEVLSYYMQKVESIEDPLVLEQIIEFALQAKKQAVADGNDGYVSRACDTLAENASVRIVALDPGHEGVYEVELEKEIDNLLTIDRIVVLDSTSQDNLVVNFINTKYKKIVFSYQGAVILGNTIKGSSIGEGAMSSQFELKFNRRSGKVEGFISTTRTKDISFSGQRAFEVSSIFEGEKPYEITANDVIGEMEGKIGDVEGTLIIQNFVPGVYSASFIAKKGELKIDYNGKFYPKKGVLSLTHKNSNKLVISLRNYYNKAKWKGAAFTSITGNVEKAIFSPIK